MDAEEKRFKVTEWRFDCYLEEYKNRTTEIERAYGSKHAFYVLEFMFFGAVLSLLCTKFLGENPSKHSLLIKHVLLLSPAAFYFLAAIHFEGHLRVIYNAMYIQNVIKSKVENLLCCNKVLEWEEYLSEKRNSTGRRAESIASLLTCEIILHILCPLALLLLLICWRAEETSAENIVNPVRLCWNFTAFVFNDIKEVFFYNYTLQESCGFDSLMFTFQSLGLDAVDYCFVAINIICCLAVIVAKCKIFNMYKNICEVAQ